MRQRAFLDIIIFSLFLSIMSGGEILAQTSFPTKPISLIIPWVAGGPTDLTGRALANATRKHLGQPIICENKPGGAGSVGVTLVLAKPPDGYTIGLYTTPTTNAWRMGLLTFNPIDDLTHIMCYGSYLSGLVVRADSPWNTIQELIKYVKDNPKKISYGSPGIGTINHLSMEQLSLLAGLQWTHIPYKGDAELNTALLGGHIDFMISGSGWIPLVDGGKFRLLAILGPKRSDRYGQVPTLKETGYDTVDTILVGIFGPKGMSREIVGKLHDAFKKGMDDPEFIDVMNKFHMKLFYLNTEENERRLRQDSEQIGKIIQKLGMDKRK